MTRTAHCRRLGRHLRASRRPSRMGSRAIECCAGWAGHDRFAETNTGLLAQPAAAGDVLPLLRAAGPHVRCVRDGIVDGAVLQSEHQGLDRAVRLPDASSTRILNGTDLLTS